MLASQEFRDATRRTPSSIVSHTTIFGEKVVSAYAPAAGGWTVGVAAGAGELGRGPGALLLTSILAAIAVSGSLLLTYLNSRSLAQRMRELEAKTRSVFTGDPIARRRPAFVSSTASATPWRELRSFSPSGRSNNVAGSGARTANERGAFSASGRQPAAAGLDGSPRRPHRLYERPPRKLRSNRPDGLGRNHPSRRSARDGRGLASRERGWRSL